MATEFDADLQSPDVDARAVLGLVGGFLIFAAVSVVGIGAYYIHAHVGRPLAPREFPKPRLETRNRQELGALQKAQRAELQDYAWVDRDRGLVRIPVERAMQIIAARGAEAYDPAESPKPAATPSPSPSPALATAPTSPRTTPKPTPSPPPAATPASPGGSP